MNSTFTGPSLLDVIETLPVGRYLWRAIRLPLALGLAILAQAQFINQRTNAMGGVILLLASLVVFLVALKLDGLDIPRDPAVSPDVTPATGDLAVPQDRVRWFGVVLGLVLSGLAYVAADDLTFTPFGVFAWLMSVLAWMYAFWEGSLISPATRQRLGAWWQALRRDGLSLRLSRAWLLFLAMMAVAAFTRYYRLDSVPPEMTSDHVEKLLDVNDVLSGQRPLFFQRNTGREPFQFYFSALIANVLGTGRTFLTLKIGAALMGVLTIPFIYLLGREVGDKKLGLIAGSLAAIGLWPQTITRVGLRFPYGPVFVAPVLYFLLRGLRRNSRNDFLLAGFFLGAGLYGYTAFRVMPLVVGLLVLLFMFRRQAVRAEMRLVANLAALIVVTAAVFVPLFRYTVANPEMFWYRTLGRVSDTETQISGSPLGIFMMNQWNALRMFNWTSDQVWVNTVPGRPALDTLAGGMFILGVAYLVYRLVRHPNATDLALLVAVPVLLLPSTLSLAFPNENPSVVRAAGAIPLVFLIAAFPLRLLLEQMRAAFGARYGQALGIGLVVLGLGLSAREMYYEYYTVYPEQYIGGAQNASELGQVVHDYAETFGTYDTAWVKAYPYWVDTRAVGMYSGDFGWDNVFIDPAEFAQTVGITVTKLFILKAEDLEGVAALRQLYPNGVLAYHTSKFPGKDFLTFLVPGTADFDENQLAPPSP